MSRASLGSELHFREFVTADDYFCHGIKEVLVNKHTDFQQLLILDGITTGRALILDGKWQSCEMDEFLYHEPLVHPPCVQQGGPKTVLVLGGGEGATVREALKWNTVERVVMVDIDEQVVSACKEHLASIHQGAFEDARTELVIGDALDYIANADAEWDVIISDLSDPIEEGPSFKLFTREMFESCRRILTPGGTYVVQAGSVAPYDMDMHVKLIKTMQAAFDHVTAYNTYVPTFASPWGFVMGCMTELDTRPDPETVDALLAEKTNGNFRTFDGESLLGLLQQPKYIRDAVEAETEIFSLDAPPKVFG
jgi:spermidine synthase